MPGVGVKYTLRLHDGGRIAVILHNDGTREVYWFRHAHDAEPRAVINLDDDEARQLRRCARRRLRAAEDRR